MNKISIIVPVYNVEQYLDRCLESIVNQSYRNLEIIMINDGSTDSSAAMCEKWKERDKRIQVVHQENKGLGFARNEGIKRASGDYITFCDSDDWYSTLAFEKLNGIVEKYHPDVLDFGYTMVTEDARENIMLTYYDEGFYGEAQIHQEILPNYISKKAVLDYSKRIVKSVWSKLYKREIIRDTFFKSEAVVLSEDYLFNMEIFSKMKTYYLHKEALYYYYIREGSLTQRYIVDAFSREKNLIRAYAEVIEKVPNNELLRERIEYAYIEAMYICVQNVCRKVSKKSYLEVKKELSTVLHDSRLQKAIRNKGIEKNSLNERGVFLLMKLKNPFLFYYVYKFCVRK